MTNDPKASRATELAASRGADRSLHELVRAAFDAAREREVETWDQMTVAVLKNRLLDLTQREFNERDYGAQSMTDLVRRRLTDLVTLNDEARPPVVRLLQPEERRVSVPDDVRRVRRDLWDSILDYRAQARYIWDGTRARREGDLEHGETAARDPALPTLTEADMDEWRAAFNAEESSFLEADEQARAKVEQWRRHRLGTSALPASLKPRWNAYLKRAVVSRLRSWFVAESIAEPVDLLVHPMRRRDAASPAAAADPEALRRLIVQCVREMTVDELRALPLPAGAVLRAQS